MTNIMKHLIAAREYAETHPGPAGPATEDLYDANGDFAYIHQI